MGVLSFKGKTHPGAMGTKPTSHLGKPQYLQEVGIKTCRPCPGMCWGGQGGVPGRGGPESLSLYPWLSHLWSPFICYPTRPGLKPGEHLELELQISSVQLPDIQNQGIWAGAWELYFEKLQSNYNSVFKW